VVDPPGGFKLDNPTIAAQRGQITLHGIKDRVADLEMGGSCPGCGMASMTLRQGVGTRVRALPRDPRDRRRHQSCDGAARQ